MKRQGIYTFTPENAVLLRNILVSAPIRKPGRGGYVDSCRVPALFRSTNLKLFYLRSINPMIEKINPTIPIPITRSPIPNEQREIIMAKSSIAIPNPIFFIVNPPLQMPICCLIFVFKLYHKTCEQFYRNFGLYEKSPDGFLPGLSHSIINQFRFHNLICLCLASVHLPHPFHLVFGFQLFGHAVLLCQ